MKRLVGCVAAFVLLVSASAHAADGGSDAGDDSGKPTTTPSENPKYVDAGEDDAGASSTSGDDGGGCNLSSGHVDFGAAVLLSGIVLATRRRRRHSAPAR